MGRQPRRWGASHGEHRLPPRLAVAGARRLLLLAPSPPARPPCLLLPPPVASGPQPAPLALRASPAGGPPPREARGPRLPCGPGCPPCSDRSGIPPTPDPRPPTPAGGPVAGGAGIAAAIVAGTPSRWRRAPRARGRPRAQAPVDSRMRGPAAPGPCDGARRPPAPRSARCAPASTHTSGPQSGAPAVPRPPTAAAGCGGPG